MPRTPTHMRRRGVSGAVLALLGLLVGVSGCGESDDPLPPARGAGVGRPAVEGPITGGKGAPLIASTTFDLAQVGYAEAEYFISGTATAYTGGASFPDDGKWAVRSGNTAAYKTRILVHRPIEPKHFSLTRGHALA